MANFCLIPSEVDKFKGALMSGKIDPAKLASMTSEERHNFFKDITGEANAKGVNALFESKLLLKNQQAGMVRWAKSVSGMNPEVQRDLVSRIQKLDHILDPVEEKQFLKDLASTKLGMNVTQEEAKHIAKLSQRVQETKAKMGENFTFKSEADRMDYGRALVQLQDHVAEMKAAANKFTPTDYLRHPIKSASKAAGLAKSLKATLDNSVIGRQGLKVMFTHPTVWAKNSLRTFNDMWKEFGGKNALDEVRAEVLSRPNALNGLYKKEGLDLGVIEEAYPSHAPGKVPVLGRAFKASESAFTGFQYRTRADLFDKYVEIANKADGDTKGIGLIANSLTGRGSLGRVEPVAGTLNNIFFSPRLLKSNFDTLTGHATQRAHGKLGATAKRQAAINMLKVITGIAGILEIANAVKPGSVEFDPRSADFGKIKVGHTRFDVTGGMSSLATLAARATPHFGGVKSSNTGGVTKLNSGQYGAQNVLDLLTSFAQNKLSPAGSLINDTLLRGQDFQGNKPTVKGEAANVTVPLSITTFNELKNDPQGANKWAGLIADGLGISVNTYGKSTKDWNQNPSTQQKAFKQSVGPDKFKQANQDYNNRLDKWMKFVTTNPTYKGLPDDQKQAVLSSGKAKLQVKVMKDHGFTYKRQKTPQSVRNAKKALLPANL